MEKNTKYKRKTNTLYVFCGKMEYNFLSLLFSQEQENQMLAENIMNGKSLAKTYYYLDFRLLYHFKKQIKNLKASRNLDYETNIIIDYYINKEKESLKVFEEIMQTYEEREKNGMKNPI